MSEKPQSLTAELVVTVPVLAGEVCLTAVPPLSPTPFGQLNGPVEVGTYRLVPILINDPPLLFSSSPDDDDAS